MTRVRFRHRVYNFILRAPVRLFGYLKYGYHIDKVFKIKKKENVLILSNHQNTLDPLWVTIGFNKPLYFVAGDTLFSNGIGSKFLNHVFAPIPKKKGTVDPNCVKQILKTMKEGGSVAIFPEGNLSYAEFQFYMDEGLARLVKKINKPLVLYNLSGGNGVSPRFSKKIRKGKFIGYVKKVLYPEEYLNYTDQELLKIIQDNLKVYDSENGNLYKSNLRAEYLERMIFVCPKCGKIETFHSQGNLITCSSCNLTVEYTEDLHLKSNDPSFNFTILNDWYQFQKQWCKNYQVSDEVIFYDQNIELYVTKVNEKRKLIYSGEIKLFKDKLVFNNISINLIDIHNASVIGGRKFNFSTLECDYFVIGHARFNPLKYVLMFNRLDTYMRIHNLDKYFNLD